MTTLYISEFAGLPITPEGVMQASDASQWVTDQTVPIGVAASSAAFNQKTNLVVISRDATCSIVWIQPGMSGTATTSNLRLLANTTMTFGVKPGMKLSVVSNT
jgi:hypothetical protein